MDSDTLKMYTSFMLRLRRQSYGMNQSELAREANLHRQIVNAAEHARHVPSDETAKALARVLFCQPEEFLPHKKYIEQFGLEQLERDLRTIEARHREWLMLQADKLAEKYRHGVNHTW